MADNRHVDVSTLKIRDVATGVVLSVQAQPGSRRNGLTGIHNGRLKVAVTQVAERGKANQELVKVLASALELRRGTVTLQSGELAALKDFFIEGLTADQLRSRIEAILTR
ncbi:MAG: DUF167 domain-containing protein [Planctomycetaceae bacterium]